MPGTELATRPPTKPPAGAAKGWCEPRWLAAWSATEIPPATREAIGREITAAERALVPASAKERVVTLEDTLSLYRLPANWEAVAKFYLEAVQDVPLDLLREGMKHLRLSYKFPNFPTPADLRLAVNPLLTARKVALYRLKAARLKATG